jgi:hypothetical protein
MMKMKMMHNTHTTIHNARLLRTVSASDHSWGKRSVAATGFSVFDDGKLPTHPAMR